MNSGTIFYKLSESQKSIWYLEKAHSGTSINIVAGNVRLQGDVDYPALQKSLNLFVKKNESMRLRIVEEDGEASQYVTEHQEFDVDFFDFSENGGLKALFAWDEETTKKPFDIIGNQLFYCALFKLSEKEGGFYMKMHHLISDAWTMGLVGKQVIDAYSNIKKGLPVDETPCPSYIDHVRMEEAYTTSLRFEKDRKYWNEKFETLPEMTVLKTRKSGETSIKAKRKTMIAPAKFSKKLRQFSKENGLSVFTLFMAALAIYINRVAGYQDMVLGTTILNRVNARDKRTTGMFVSIAAPVRITLDDDMDFKTFAGVMLKESTDVLKHQKYPYNYLIRDLKKKHKLSNRLFDIVLSYQNSKLNKDESEEEYVAKWLFSGCQIESLVISINDREEEGNLLIDYDFLTDVFSVKEIEFIHQHILRLLWHGLDNPARKISKLEMISEKEKHTIVYDFNNTVSDYPKDKTMQQIFEEQAEKTPDNIALVFEDETMTYAQLNKRANQLARTLRAEGIGPDDVVGIIIERSFDMIVAILAAVKAGGAYLPIDPNHPAERKHYMLEDSGAKALLTIQPFLSDITFNGIIINLADALSYSSNTTNLPAVNKPSDLLYVIYTSGSTGQPKGVMVEHTGVVNRIWWMLKQYPLNGNNVIMQKTTYCFDVSVLELFPWFFAGASLYLLGPGDEKEPAAIVSAVEKHNVTVIHFVPSMLGAFLSYVESADNVSRLSSLKNVFACGEALLIQQVEAFNATLFKQNNTILINLYGPTEASIMASYFDCSPMPELNSVPIGRPTDGVRLYIFDPNRNLLPIGVPGELYIGGVGIARGYKNKPEMTAEKFITNPYKPDEIIYKTGDKARWYPKGDIEFFGRTDYQVKIKGFRIELGEIEAKLLSVDSVRDAVVKVFKDDNGQSFLTAFVTTKDNFRLEDVRMYLFETLPEYMLPVHYVVLDSIPLNSNGKADRNALQRPNQIVPDNTKYEPPQNEIEEALAGIWENALGLERLSMLAEYSNLGGDSLTAIKIITKIHKNLGVELSPKLIFSLQTIRRIASHIESISKSEYQHIPLALPEENYPVSSAQKSQYILNMIEGGISYNLPGGLHILGEVDFEKLQKAFSEIVRRHESLRTSFELKDGVPVQIVHDTMSFYIEQEMTETLTLDECIKAFVRSFDLKHAPLLRVKLISFSQKKHVLLFDMHHIISDGASINIMVRELVSLYNGDVLPQFTVQYKDYSVWHNELLKSEKMQQQEKYWLDRFSDEIPMLSLPTDYPRPSVQSYKGARLSFSINERLTKQIKQVCAETETTLFMMLYTAYSVLLFKYTGQEDVVVAMPVEGRRHEDLRHIIGMFVNTLAVRSYPAGDKPFKVFLDEVKEDLINAYEHQEYPFETLVEKLGIKRDPSRNPLFDTMFVLQNTDLSAFSDIGFSAELFAYRSNTSKFDITIEALDQGDTIEYSIEYCTDLFEEETIQRLSSHYSNVLADIVEHPTKKLCDIDILSKQERHQLLVDFNDTAADFPRDKTIHQIFEEQAEKTPDNIALVFENETMTYTQLNNRANQLARTLRGQGIGPDDVVGLIVDRSFDMIIAIFGVLKSGGAYMPIDPEYPSERKQYMLENSGAKVVITKSVFDNTFNATTINLDHERIYDNDKSNLEPNCKSSDLAHIIYTSGSTGRPKGVMTEHRNVVGLLFNNGNRLTFNEFDTWVFFHSYCFDMGLWELLGSLLNGGKLVIIKPEATLDLNIYYKILVENKVTVLVQTPQFMYNLIDLEKKSKQHNLYVRYVCVGGEALIPSLLQPLKKIYPDVEFYNLYGPTETTMYVTQKRMAKIEDFETSSNIGVPNALTKVYVTNKYSSLVPIGIAGELCVSGNGVARGYINKNDLTNKVFVSNPFDECSDRIYKTGDLVKMTSLGELIYIGRLDNQVKIRGYRIELEEIENVLNKHEAVEQAVVITHEASSGSKMICAYIKAKTSYSTDELISFISKKLPKYMIPSTYINIDAFHLNENGKIDKTQLPKPSDAIFTKANYERPRNLTEELIVDTWSDILDIPLIGIDDNFFELGGDSLSAVKVISRLDLGIKIVDLYTYPTIRKLAEHILASRDNNTLLINMSRDYSPSHRNVVCFPYGGGSAISYSKISKSASDNQAGLNIYSVRIPGHDFGVEEELQPLESVAEQIASEIISAIKGEIVLYGHCAGNGLMLAVARTLEANGVEIKAFFVGGLLVPEYIKHFGWIKSPIGLYTDNSVRKFLRKTGIDGELLYNGAFLRHMRLVTRRVKLELDKYLYRLVKNKAEKMTIPLVVVVGDSDPLTRNYQKKFLSWQQYFNDVHLLVLEKAEHFFINTHPDDLVNYFSSF